jgi:aminoglycoside 6'-N-acetyltransferase
VCDDEPRAVRPCPARLPGERVLLRLVAEEDFARLAAVVIEPEVAAWWPRHDLDRLQEDMLRTPGVTTYVVELSGEVIGAIQCTEETSPSHKMASIDLFLDSTHLGEGLGSDALRTLARWLFEGRAHHRLTIDPAIANLRARRAYEKVGFSPVGVMRRYERGPDCEWRDALLMDMLAGELR